jgi:hypothetical protein
MSTDKGLMILGRRHINHQGRPRRTDSQQKTGTVLTKEQLAFVQEYTGRVTPLTNQASLDVETFGVLDNAAASKLVGTATIPIPTTKTKNVNIRPPVVIGSISP